MAERIEMVINWQDHVEDDRLHSSVMNTKYYSMVVQQPDQRSCTPYREGNWMLSSDLLGLTRHTLSATNGEEAKKEAVLIAKANLSIVIGNLRQLLNALGFAALVEKDE